MNLVKSHQLLTNLFAGVVSGLINVIYSISYAALIFSGDLTPYLPFGISCALVSAVVNAVVVALFSSAPFIIAGPDSNSSAILALMAGAIALHVAASGGPLFPTVWLAIALSTVLTGVCLFGLGRLRLGGWIRFVPYPVIGGFLAAVGWLLTQGAFKVMTGTPLTLGSLSSLVQRQSVYQWLPGLVLAVTLLVVLRRWKHPALMPSLALGAIALTYVGLWATQTSITQARQQGILFETVINGRLWQAANLDVLGRLDWSAIAGQVGNELTLIAVVAITILLCASGIELATQTDMNLDQELRTAGVANILTGFCGGMVGYLSISRSILNFKAGARTRIAGLCAGAIALIVLLIGTSFLSFLPKAVFGGLLLYIGLSLLIEWLYDAWFDLSRLDYGLIIAIVLIVANFGFLEGVGVGVMIACVVFVWNYSQLRVIKNALSGKTYRSKYERSFHQKLLLNQRGHEIYILKLQGYIFFGTANTLLEHVRLKLAGTDAAKLSFLVLDFQLTGGLDASSIISFIKMKRIAENAEATLIFTNLLPEIQAKLEQHDVLDRLEEGEEDKAVCRVFPDLDRGLEWCENQILKTAQFRRKRFVPLVMQLEEVFPIPDRTAKFLRYLAKLKIQEGEYLYRQGDVPEAMYFIESGRISIMQELPTGEVIRVGTVSEGTVLGEIGFYRGEVQPVSAVADQTCSVYRLSHDVLEKMQSDDPELASACHQFIARLLAERIAQADERTKALLQ